MIQPDLTNKDEKNVIIVGGTFDSSGGKPSFLINKLFSKYPDALLINGGYFEQLKDIMRNVQKFRTVFWLADVDNTMVKIRNVKKYNPTCMLVTSKRNDNEKYCFEELINKTLEVKANLTIEFSKLNGLFHMRVYDPLGAVWCDKTTDTDTVKKAIIERLSDLRDYTRQSCVLINQTCKADKTFEVEEEFLNIIHEKAKVFHDLIQPPEVVSRFLGNVSFRCTNGFPSALQNGRLIVSKRNVNKEGISKSDFVRIITEPENEHLFAIGNQKPSVDTPVQVRLYDRLPHIRYMLHSHVYIDGAPFTDKAIPCIAIEEVDSIMRCIEKNNIDTSKSFGINLLGHGNTVFATDLSYFSTVSYVKRPTPEVISKNKH